MGKKKGPRPTKGLSKSEKKALKKLPKGQRDLVAGAMRGGSVGAKAWSSKLLGAGSSAEKEQVKAKPMAPHQTALALFRKPDQRVLLVGEGNFSFTRSLIGILNGQGSVITATGHDSQEVMERKYLDAAENVDFATNSGAQVLFEIDGTRLEASTDLDPPYDVVIFNFPHVGLGIKDQAGNIEANAQLVSDFLESACNVVHEKGIICVTVKKGMPYDEWKIPRLGLKIGSLRLKNTVPFDPASFPDYAHRRTAGCFAEDPSGSDNDIMAHGAHTYIFTPQKDTVKGDGENGGNKKAAGKGKKNKKSFTPSGPNPKGSAGRK
mmetsp:Transcript_32544/g.79886  ORF Transcript_32544/g.79886 Transcript_32544/m.79886 type:complete len:321 (-) Transcript_32544:235-1197(-)